MTAHPPRCEWCHVNPVQRVYGDMNRFKRGRPRIIDGEAWRWFCSKACSGKAHAQAALASPVRKAGHTVWTKAAQRRCLQRITDACRGAMDANGKVDPKDFVRFMMRELMVARYQAAETGRRQQRRVDDFQDSMVG